MSINDKKHTFNILVIPKIMCASCHYKRYIDILDINKEYYCPNCGYKSFLKKDEKVIDNH